MLNRTKVVTPPFDCILNPCIFEGECSSNNSHGRGSRKDRFSVSVPDLGIEIGINIASSEFLPESIEYLNQKYGDHNYLKMFPMILYTPYYHSIMELDEGDIHHTDCYVFGLDGCYTNEIDIYSQRLELDTLIKNTDDYDEIAYQFLEGLYETTFGHLYNSHRGE